jgi:predicted MFS family arabinose efflux permease
LPTGQADEVAFGIAAGARREPRPGSQRSIRALSSLARVVVGGDVDRRVLPVAAFTFIYSASFSTFWVYVGVYAVKGLGWPASRVGLLFLVTAPAAAVANYLSGRLSDDIGRKPLIVASFVASAANAVALSQLGHHVPVAFALIVLQGVIGAPAYSLDRVVVADVVSEQEAREQAYASVRVTNNLGAFTGPPLAALLIFLGGWNSFLLGIAALGCAGAVVTSLFLPSTGHAGANGPTGRFRAVLRDRPFVLLLVSTLLAFTDYCGFETVLPVIAVTAYGLAPSTWGLLVAISPLLVVLAQLRLTRAASRVPTGRRLGVATLLMGLPFLALIASSNVAVIVGVIVVFVVGEMIWLPTSQSVAAALAPPAVRGSYFGALAATTGPAWTLAPLIALELRAHVGVGSVWILFAAVGFLGAGAGVAAVRAAGSRGR